ncbi:MAG TPA: apolipoprotein N-acyltransferase [Pirellulales bacterium]|nr:apolipoprotein N-acyltransferase [Pirellulales bacterium]
MPTTIRTGRRAPAMQQGDEPAAASWWSATLALAVCGQALFWAALPPLGLWPLAWLAPVPWLLLVRRDTLCGRRPYIVLWASSFGFWLAALYWLTLPHWATSIGWLAVSVYLACYFPLFIALARVAVQQLGLSVIVAAPVVWTALELVRAHALGGFGMVLLAHTQYRWPLLLQISDLAGGYAVSFVIVLMGACLARMGPVGDARRAWWPVLPLTACLVVVLGYGHARLSEPAARPGPKVALIQGSIDIEMKHDPAQAHHIYDEYLGLSRRAVREHPDLELIVWPETMFPYPWCLFDAEFTPPADAEISAEQMQERSHQAVADTVATLGTACLLGIGTFHGTADETRHYNSALFVARDGQVLGRYDKNHLVMFGEYVPLAETFPWLYRLTPLPGGLNRGQSSVAIEIGQTCYAANICFENTVPHLARSQILSLRSEHHEPDVLVTLTNDGWFWGSSELDLHLACGVFRAIECRKPCLIAANTGFSAWIDGDGQIRAQGPRRAPGVLVAEPMLDSRRSWYLEYGDLWAGSCLVATGIFATVGLRGRRWRKKRSRPAV